MILNHSRADLFRACSRKAQLTYEKGLVSNRIPDYFTTGGSVHKGLAVYAATGNVESAIKEALEEFEKRLDGQDLLPEEMSEINVQRTLTQVAIKEYAHYFEKDQVQVIQPEVRFCVPLPETEHHCYYLHRLLWPNVSFFECGSEACVSPHYYAGITDAVVQWNRMIWLMEHKTSGARDRRTYFRTYMMDSQITGYIYGIHKKIGLRPHGAIVNVIFKPAKNASNRFSVEFEREPFLRTEQDLHEFEKEISITAFDYEEAMVNDRTTKNDQECIRYSYVCQFHKICLAHGEYSAESFRKRETDYIDEFWKEVVKERSDMYGLSGNLSRVQGATL